MYVFAHAANVLVCIDAFTQHVYQNDTLRHNIFNVAFASFREIILLQTLSQIFRGQHFSFRGDIRH